MLDDGTLWEVLVQWNIWTKKLFAGLNRDEYISRLVPLLERKEILILKGIRRCGKSTIMRQLMFYLLRKGVGKNQILFLNLEDYNLKDSLSIDLLDRVLGVFRGKFVHKKKVYFFIDEIQNIPEFELWLRTKYDLGENLKFIISGSNASLLSPEYSEKLTGRNLSFNIFPLSFDEFKFFSNGSLSEFLEFGGFPEVVLETNFERKRLLLQQYFEDIVRKDIIQRHNIRNQRQVLILAKFLAANPGVRISYKKISNKLNISDSAVKEYIEFMKEAFFLIEVPFFSYSYLSRHARNVVSKFYICDNGFCSIANIRFSEDKSKKFENLVAIRLSGTGEEVSYWRKNNEVDFVIKDIAINVVASLRIPKREFEGLREIQEVYKSILVTLIVSEKSSKQSVSLLKFLGVDLKNIGRIAKFEKKSVIGLADFIKLVN